MSPKDQSAFARSRGDSDAYSRQSNGLEARVPENLTAFSTALQGGGGRTDEPQGYRGKGGQFRKGVDIKLRNLAFT